MANDAPVASGFGKDDEGYAQKQFAAPPGATEILLVRHGASQTFVPGGDFPMKDGQGDPALSPEGQEQATLVGARLAAEPISKVYVTTMQRTVQTAQPLVDANGYKTTVVPDLREICLGEWEGGIGRQKLTEQTDPVAIQVLESGTWDAVPGAEKFADFSGRCMKALEQVTSENANGKVVAFVHGGVIAAIVNVVMGSAPRWIPIDNCSITHVVAIDGRFMIKGFNDTAHLGGLFT